MTSVFTKSRNTLVKVGSEPQKEPDGKHRTGSRVIAKQTSKEPLVQKTTGTSRANTPQVTASATGEFKFGHVSYSCGARSREWIKAYKAEIDGFLFGRIVFVLFMYTVVSKVAFGVVHS